MFDSQEKSIILKALLIAAAGIAATLACDFLAQMVPGYLYGALVISVLVAALAVIFGIGASNSAFPRLQAQARRGERAKMRSGRLRL